VNADFEVEKILISGALFSCQLSRLARYKGRDFRSLGVAFVSWIPFFEEEVP
jgi:hypothetical protein